MKVKFLLFSRSVTSDTLWPHGLQHARLFCPSPSPGTCSNSCSLRWWCHPTISFSVVPFSSCLLYFPASWSFLMSQIFTSGGQSIGASASVLLVNIQGWSPLRLIGLISLQKMLIQCSLCTRSIHVIICIIFITHPLDHRKSKRVPEKNIYFCFIDYAKASDCVDHNKLWEIL